MWGKKPHQIIYQRFKMKIKMKNNDLKKKQMKENGE